MCTHPIWMLLAALANRRGISSFIYSSISTRSLRAGEKYTAAGPLLIRTDTVSAAFLLWVRSVVGPKVGGHQCIAGPRASKFGGTSPTGSQPHAVVASWLLFSNKSSVQFSGG